MTFSCKLLFFLCLWTKTTAALPKNFYPTLSTIFDSHKCLTFSLLYTTPQEQYL